MNNQLLLHIGYSKAGSSWLQEYFRQKNSGFNHVFSHTDLLYENIVLPHPLSFEPSIAKEILYPCINAVSPDQIPVVSYERLCGHWASGGYDTKEIAVRLHQILPEANVLIIIREQKSMISSIYRQYVRKGGGRKLVDFLNPPKFGKGRYPMFDFTFLEYHKIIALYQQLFGKDKVLVLPMEILKENPLQFCNKIRMFSGLNELPELKVSEKPRNEGIKAYMVSYRRISNPFIRKDALNDYSLFYSRIAEKIIGFILNIAENITPDSVRKNHDRKLREEIGLIVSDRYKESNRQTGLLTNLELGNYAYDID